MGFIALRRNYQDSYLEEIDQQGSNGFLVRRPPESSTGDSILAQADLTIEMKFPTITHITLPWFCQNDKDNSDFIVIHQSYTLATNSDLTTASHCRYDQLNRKFDCSQPEPINVLTPVGSWYSVEDESSSTILRLEGNDVFHTPSSPLGPYADLFKPYWGTLNGEMPVAQPASLTSEAKEGQWMLGLEFYWRTPSTTRPRPTPPEHYYRRNTSPHFVCWLYSKPQHRLELNKPLDFVFSFSDSGDLPKTSIAQYANDPWIFDRTLYEREVRNCLTSIFEGKKITVTLKEAKTRTVNETST